MSIFYSFSSFSPSIITCAVCTLFKKKEKRQLTVKPKWIKVLGLYSKTCRKFLLLHVIIIFGNEYTVQDLGDMICTGKMTEKRENMCVKIFMCIYIYRDIPKYILKFALWEYKLLCFSVQSEYSFFYNVGWYLKYSF